MVSVIFERQRNCGTRQSKFLKSANYSFNDVIQIAAMSTQQVALIYIYVGVSVYWPLCVQCVFEY